MPSAIHTSGVSRPWMKRPGTRRREIGKLSKPSRVLNPTSRSHQRRINAPRVMARQRTSASITEESPTCRKSASFGSSRHLPSAPRGNYETKGHGFESRQARYYGESPAKAGLSPFRLVSACPAWLAHGLDADRAAVRPVRPGRDSGLGQISSTHLTAAAHPPLSPVPTPRVRSRRRAEERVDRPVSRYRLRLDRGEGSVFPCSEARRRRSTL